MSKAYELYSSSGIPWMTQMPAHWDTRRAKYMYKKENRPVSDNADVITCFRDGTVTLRKNRRTTGFTESIKEIGYQGILEGDLVIHVMDAFAGAIGVSDSDGKGTPVYSVCTALGNYNNHYYAYALREMAKKGFIQSLYRGIRERSSDFRFDVFGNQTLPIPPKEEQDQIVRYLDWQVSKINKLIVAKKKKKAMFQECKKGIVMEILTGAFSEKNETKTVRIHAKRSIRIPINWEIKPLCSMAKIKSIPNCVDLELLSVYLDAGVVPFSSRSEKRTNATSKDLSKYQRVDAGDFVMNNQQAWRGSVGVSDYTGIVSPAYVVLALDSALSRKYANYLLRSPLMVEQYLMSSKGVGSIQRNVYWPTIKRAQMIVPPLEKQLEIERIISKQTEVIDSISRTIDTEIELLQELKNKLISDVVTGQIDVRGIEIPDYQFVEEEPDYSETDEENGESTEQEEE